MVVLNPDSKVKSTVIDRTTVFDQYPGIEKWGIKNAFFPLLPASLRHRESGRGWKKKWGMAKLFLMNWDWCIWKLNYTIANAVPKNNNKILKRFKPNKFAKFWGKIYFQMSFTALFFFFLLEESYITINWIITASFLFG